jgi:4-phytase/acid phosphatase
MTGAISAALAAVWLISSGPPSAAAAPPDTLVQIVLVSRHGVRTPTMSNDVLASFAQQPWPAWKEPLGNLTARGRRLATLVGAYHRQALAAEKLLPASGCPDAGRVYVYADVSERTERTAEALLDGLAPGCGIPVRSKSPAKVDGVFHPVAAGVCRIDPLEAQSAVLARIGGDFPGFMKNHEAELEALQSILGCCAPALCSAFGHASACTLPDLPTALTSLANGQGISMIGALSIASTASEIFLLEYADGRPKEEVGWGRADLAGIRKVLPLHDTAFDLLFRTPYLARRQGSSLLARAAGAVTGRPIGGLPAPEPAVRDARLVAYVGHDDNLAKMGGLLGAMWSLPGYPANETPPAGALVFERRRAPDGSERVFASFLAQSLEQMRGATPLTLAAPPLRAPIRIPGCSRDEPGYPCSVEDFARVVSRTLDAECVDRAP